MASTASLRERLLDLLRHRRVASAHELAETLGVSQPTLSRTLAAAGSDIARIGRARRSRYSLTHHVRGLGSRWPLHRIDGQGQPRLFGELTALHGEGCLVAVTPSPDWLRGEFADGLFPGLPWFLDDQRPQGFLGRQFGLQWSRELGLPADILRWDEDAVLAALLLRGEDAPGDFVLGELALERTLSRKPAAIAASARGTRYAQLARAALEGSFAGSSAGGEQPKFTACVHAADGSLRHVIVKFAEPPVAHPAAQRWSDLLGCEHLAATVLAAHGQPAAQTELVQAAGWTCLESTRFDRHGAHGRSGLVTLAAWSDAHDGERDDWAATAARMYRDGWIDAVTLQQIRLRWWFGRLIGNTDMHFGNLAFRLGDALPLQLAPSYDMLPMLYRPAANGSVVPRDFDPAPPTAAALAVWQEAAVLAIRFWREVAASEAISEEFRHIAEANHQLLHERARRFAADTT